MLNIVLNVLGIILILYAVISLKKSNRQEDFVFDKKEMKSEDVFYDFKEILEEKAKEVELEERQAMEKEEEAYEVEISQIDEDILRNLNKNIKLNKYKEYNDLKPRGLVREVKKEARKENLSPKNQKIIDLYEIGLAKEEIAKQVSRSVREIEVILKIYGRS